MKALMVKKILLFIAWALAVILPLPAISGVNSMIGWSLFAAFISPAVIAIIFSWMPKQNHEIAKLDKRFFHKIKIKNYAIASLIIGLIIISVFADLYLSVKRNSSGNGMAWIVITVYLIYSFNATVVCGMLLALVFAKKKLNLGKDFKKYLSMTVIGFILSLSPIMFVMLSGIF